MEPMGTVVPWSLGIWGFGVLGFGSGLGVSEFGVLLRVTVALECRNLVLKELKAVEFGV